MTAAFSPVTGQIQVCAGGRHVHPTARGSNISRYSLTNSAASLLGCWPAGTPAFLPQVGGDRFRTCNRKCPPPACTVLSPVGAAGWGSRKSRQQSVGTAWRAPGRSPVNEAVSNTGEVQGTGGHREGPSPASAQGPAHGPASVPLPGGHQLRCKVHGQETWVPAPAVHNPAASVTLATSPSSQASALPVQPRTREDRVCEATVPGAPPLFLDRPRIP